MNENTGSGHEILKIIGIGASASGLQALEAFFSNCPKDSGLSFVVVQHLSPDFKSMHASLLARKTEIPISVAEASMAVEPNHIYLIPRNENIILRNNKLELLKRAPAPEINRPIDLFFTSLATEKKEGAVGVILSGSGSDGTIGAAAIREGDGIIFVQNPEESGFSGMPLSVINAHLADYVLNAGQMPSELISYFNFVHKSDSKEEESVVEKILQILKDGTQHDFTTYRRQTLNRRIVKRINIKKLENTKAYKRFLENNPEEQDILVNEFLIGVTRFFRDNLYFDTLKEKVIPNIIANKKKGETIKVWVVGCVSGEEAYSLAILFKENLALNEHNIDFKIFATDINAKAIEKASKGHFEQNITADIDPAYLSKYFQRKGSHYVVQPFLRRHIIFSCHDILHNPPFNKMDLISCRNLLIYFQDIAQERAIKRMLYALNLHGYLFLGTSESLGPFSRYFEVIDHRGKIFSKKLEFSGNFKSQDIFSTKIEKLPTKKLPEFTSELTIQFTKNLALVTNCVCICVNENIQVLEVFGSLRLVGSLPDEGFSSNLLKLLPKSFHVPVASAIRTLSKSSAREEVISKLVDFTSQDKSFTAKIVFSRFDQKIYPYDKFFLITINVEEPPKGRIVPPQIDAETASSIEIKQLQNLLEDTRENLQITIEELEASNEEAQATNEELVSSNEELQSTNEELQSVNEELYTVNAELQEKNIQLLEVNADIENLISSSRIATLFLDDRLHIRRFTPPLTKIVNLRESDIGRSITNFSLPDKHFLKDIESVIQTKQMLRKDIVIDEKKHFLQEINFYASENEKNKGAVINYIDITDLSRASLEIKEKTKFLKDILTIFPGSFFIYDLEEQKNVFSNHSFAAMVGYTPGEIYDMEDGVMAKLSHPEDLKSVKRHLVKMRKAKENQIFKLKFRLITGDRQTKWVESTDKPFEINNNGTVRTILGFLTDAPKTAKGPSSSTKMDEV